MHIFVKEYSEVFCIYRKLEKRVGLCNVINTASVTETCKYSLVHNVSLLIIETDKIIFIKLGFEMYRKFLEQKDMDTIATL